MQLQEVRAMAKNIGIKPGKLSKYKLIHEIQHVEGNFDCYGTAITGECDQVSCCWRKDCFAASRKPASTLSSVN